MKRKRYIYIYILIVVLLSSIFIVNAEDLNLVIIDNIHDIEDEYDYAIKNEIIGNSNNAIVTMTGDFVKIQDEPFYIMTPVGNPSIHQYHTAYGINVGPHTKRNYTGELTIKYRDAAYSTITGEAYDLEIKIKNPYIENLSGYQQPCVLAAWYGTSELDVVSNYPLNVDKIDNTPYIYSGGTTGVNTPNVSLDVEARVVDKNGNYKNGTIPWIFTDLDQPDRTKTYGAPYAESVEVQNTIKKAYIQDNTLLNHNGNRFYGTEQTDNDGGRYDRDNGENKAGFSAIFENVVKFNWKAENAGTGLWSDFIIYNGSVRVIYKTTAGQVLENWSYVQQNKPAGTSYSTAQKTFTNYRFVKVDPSSASTEGSVVGKKTLDVIYLYEPIPTGSVDVTYKTTDGTILEGPTMVQENKVEGTPYTTTQKTFNKYRFVRMDPTSAAVSGEVEGNITKHVIYIYEPIVGSVTVTHKTVDGQILKPTEYVKRNEIIGTPYNTSQETFSEYRFVRMDYSSAPANGSVVEETQHVIYLYELKPGKIKVKKQY